ncbi:hypothetical protein GALL_230830 [mine drainage metagenome]|uniref:Uncharacterized protein n=1 Tax=mine drainage metagenome TaxID=410659 RepID=A0A1J5RSD2_9ZZZZ
MTQSSTIFDRIDQAAKLSRQLTGKAAARTVSDAFVTERIADIKALHQSGVPLARYARLVAPALGVRPSALLAAFGRAGLTSQPTAPHASEVAKTETTAAPPAPVITAKPRDIHDLPSWADGSDQRDDESDEDYRLRKQLEGPPSAGFNAIGESPDERADVLLKSGKLGFGASGVPRATARSSSRSLSASVPMPWSGASKSSARLCRRGTSSTRASCAHA